jgi:peptide/nickel transport system permease protein
MELGIIVRRFVSLLPTLFGVLFLTFALAQLLPGDPTLTALGERATAAQRQRFREKYGLNRPLVERYVKYIVAVGRGDLGESLHTNHPITQDIRDLWPATFELTSAALVVTILIGLPSGVIAARYKDRVGDHIARFITLVGVSMPIFWLGLLMLLVLALWLNLFPSGGRLSAGIVPPPRFTGLYLVDSALSGRWSVFLDALWHLVLPATCLSFAIVGIVSRMVRNSLLNVLDQDYIRTARAKGVSEFTVLFRHAVRNALIPVLTVLGILSAQLLGGAVLTETIFSWPGIGRYAVEGILQLDYPTILGVTVVAAIAYLLINFVTDLVYVIVDPRLR